MDTLFFKMKSFHLDLLPSKAFGNTCNSYFACYKCIIRVQCKKERQYKTYFSERPDWLTSSMKPSLASQHNLISFLEFPFLPFMQIFNYLLLFFFQVDAEGTRRYGSSPTSVFYWGQENLHQEVGDGTRNVSFWLYYFKFSEGGAKRGEREWEFRLPGTEWRNHGGETYSVGDRVNGDVMVLYVTEGSYIWGEHSRTQRELSACCVVHLKLMQHCVSTILQGRKERWRILVQCLAWGRLSINSACYC